jgi:bleomycin hydrolase
MKNIVTTLCILLSTTTLFAQDILQQAQQTALQGKTSGINTANAGVNFEDVKSAGSTAVKNQGKTGTCWCFSTTSLIESQCLKNNAGAHDLSEMFSVRHVYVEKAKNYILRQGKTSFSEGALGHDLIKAMAKYGAVPEALYAGIAAQTNGSKLAQRSQLLKADSAKTLDYAKVIAQPVTHDHSNLTKTLKNYLDSILTNQPINALWINDYNALLDKFFGPLPTEFVYNAKKYTPKTFATEVLKFNAADYVNLTSFTHHPFYQSFALEVPDNFSNGFYINVPITELVEVTKDALKNGYTVMWDADVTNDGFLQERGVAVDINNIKDKKGLKKDDLFQGKFDDEIITQEKRQALFENLTTQDDHLMHIVGLSKNKSGKPMFNVKNSWGPVGPYQGYIAVSEGYFTTNTISIIVPKAALNKKILEKLGL